MSTNRRNFIKQSALLSAGTLMVPGFLKASIPGATDKKQQKLVVIQLSGGNDGLNTIIPYRNDIYYQLRPQLAIPKNEVLKGTDDLGFHPSLTGLKSLYDNGEVTIINSVGYPNPDRSHFRSMDIWHTASGAGEYRSYGWLGKYLDSACTSCNAHRAIEVDDALSLAMKGTTRKGLSVTNPQQLYQTTRDGSIRRFAASDKKQESGNLGYLYKTMAETTASAEYVYQTSKRYKSTLGYPNHELGKNLKLIARLINSGIDTEVFYVSLGGFDTHAGQARRHQQLLTRYSESLAVFVKDLKAGGNWSNTLVMTFSEFGRRVKQNGSNGTDHGTANNLFLMGGSLKKPGFYNDPPDLTRLDADDLIYQVDFRSVYATILEKWMGTSSHPILGGRFDVLSFI